MKAALRKVTWRVCAPPPATSGLTASAGSNFVVRTALGRRQPASILIRPGLAHSILSHRSSQTIQSESLLAWLFCTNSYTFQGAARSPKVARDATTSAPGGTERWDGTIIERTQLLLLFLLFWNCFPSLSSLPSIRGAAVSAYLNGSLEFPF